MQNIVYIMLPEAKEDVHRDTLSSQVGLARPKRSISGQIALYTATCVIILIIGQSDPIALSA